MLMQPWIYQQMIDTSPEAIIVADSAGIIRFWNTSAADVFGYSEAEAVGRTLDLIIPEAQRARHWAGYLRVVQSGETRYGRELLAFAAVRKDSSRFQSSSTSEPVSTRSGWRLLSSQ